jgi:O-methyltransferase involved in polyketide biosynthesis
MNLSLRRGPDAVSPTAHYTGETWVRNDLSHPELATWQGRLFFDALRPTMALSRVLGGPTLEGLLVARHRIIDAELEQAIEAGSIGQVIEPACGMSPRGWRFANRWGDRLTYVEADLPAMARRKRDALARMGSRTDHHRVADLDVLHDSGPLSFAGLAATLDPDVGTAVITEGLLTYLNDADVLAVWRRLGKGSRGASTCPTCDLREPAATPSRRSSTGGSQASCAVGSIHTSATMKTLPSTSSRRASTKRACTPPPTIPPPSSCVTIRERR